jgi:hypothetical protein
MVFVKDSYCTVENCKLDRIKSESVKINDNPFTSFIRSIQALKNDLEDAAFANMQGF